MREKNKHFVEVYKARWFGPYRGFDSSTFKQAFSGSPSKNLPKTTETRMALIENGTLGAMLILKPYVKGRRKARVFMHCYRCNNDIPAGRINQHTCER